MFIYRVRECQSKNLLYFDRNNVECFQQYLDMNGDFHMQFAYIKTLFRTYWDVFFKQFSIILKRKSIKKEARVFFEAEELLLHILQGYVLAIAIQSLQKKFPQSNIEMDSEWPQDAPPPLPADVFQVANEVLKSLKIIEDENKPLSNKSKDPNKVSKKMIFDIILYFYFKDSIRKSDGFSVLRSHKFLFVRFLGSFFLFYPPPFIFYYYHFTSNFNIKVVKEKTMLLRSENISCAYFVIILSTMPMSLFTIVLQTSQEGLKNLFLWIYYVSITLENSSRCFNPRILKCLLPLRGSALWWLITLKLVFFFFKV